MLLIIVIFQKFKAIRTLNLSLPYKGTFNHCCNMISPILTKATKFRACIKILKATIAYTLIATKTR